MYIHFACIYNYPIFTSKPTFARIDFLRSSGRLGEKKAAIMLKFALKYYKPNRKQGSKGAREQGDKLTRKRVNKLMGAAIFSPLLVDKVTSNKVTSLHGVSHLFTFSPFHLFTFYKPFTFSPFHLFTFYKPFTFSPFHASIISPSRMVSFLI